MNTNTLAQTTLTEFSNLHNTWKQGKKTLAWWRKETGYLKYNYLRIRHLSKIPTSCKDLLNKSVAINILYLLHLDYALESGMISPILRKKVVSMREEVFSVLCESAKSKEVNVSTSGKFPWS